MAEIGYGDGSGYGSGYGSGWGSGYGSGDGDGYGDGYGSGYGSGDGYADGSGDGYGDGYGYGSGDGSGVPDKPELRIPFFKLVKESLDARWVLAERNAELKRELIEAMGIDRFFAGLNANMAHQDIDGCGNPRALLRIPMPEAQVGYLQAVRVVCPTTGRVYHLGVPPTVKTCQEAVASTFGIKADEYQPERES